MDFNNIKSKVMETKTKMAIATTSAILIPSAIFASENPSAGTANTAVVDAMQTVANDMRATGNAIIPIALTVVGISLVVVFGVRMFKRLAK